jgi:predicted ATP-grasp superfamily ATP-dependent carboligase
MAVITRGWVEIDKTYSREHAEEMVSWMQSHSVSLVMIGSAVSRPEDILVRWGSSKIKVGARIFIENEDDAIYFVLKYL